MKLKAFGCSHIFGTDLSDCPANSRYKQCSQLSWPALLAQSMNLQYECFAWPGLGNLRIAEQILTEAEKESALFVINWTYIDRFDYIDPATNFWATLLPNNNDRSSNFYYRELHSEYRDKLTALMQIKLCIDTLTAQHRPFIMCNMDPLLFDNKWHSNSVVQQLQKSIQPHIHSFNGCNFLDFARQLGHAVSAQDHLLDSGHRACADYAALNFIQNNGAKFAHIK